MSTSGVRETSRKNEYWIPKHRYYELRHFCMQFDDWQRERFQLDGLAVWQNRAPTESEALRKASLDEKIGMVTQAAKYAGEELCITEYLMKNVTKGMTYDQMRARWNIPTNRKYFYAACRRFFYILSGLRD